MRSCFAPAAAFGAPGHGPALSFAPSCAQAGSLPSARPGLATFVHSTCGIGLCSRWKARCSWRNHFVSLEIGVGDRQRHRDRQGSAHGGRIRSSKRASRFLGRLRHHGAVDLFFYIFWGGGCERQGGIVSNPAFRNRERGKMGGATSAHRPRRFWTRVPLGNRPSAETGRVRVTIRRDLAGEQGSSIGAAIGVRSPH